MKLLILGSKKWPDKCIYEVIQTHTVTGLKYSEMQSDWSNPGSLAYTLNNTGDGLVVKDHHTGDKWEFDYSQAEAIRALLKLEDRTNDGFFKILKEDK